jgi:hypothetical protein
VDFVLISHNHYDHLDYHTIRALGPRPTYYVPLGLKEWFTSKGASVSAPAASLPRGLGAACEVVLPLFFTLQASRTVWSWGGGMRAR